MTDNASSGDLKPAMFLAVTGSFVLAGIFARFFQIHLNDFILYDEGKWLQLNIQFLRRIDQIPPQTFGQFTQCLEFIFKYALHEAKALWGIISQLRVFFTGANGYYFTRAVSALAGTATLGMLFLFACSYFRDSTNKNAYAWLSMAILALLPSHVFYSRLGIQEATTAFFFLSAMFFYFSKKPRLYKSVLSGILLSFVYFTNYRLIVLPFLLLFIELYRHIFMQKESDWRAFLYSSLSFGVMVVGVGSLYDGANFRITFTWMFFQQMLIKEPFELFNLVSYPYYLFALESPFFALAFLGNIYYVFKKEFRKLLPFALVIMVMIGFTVPNEKGARFVGFLMPFMSMSVAVLLVDLYKRVNLQWIKYSVLVFVSALFVFQGTKVYAITRHSSDYRTVMEDLKEQDPRPKVLSAQYQVVRLYAEELPDVLDLPEIFNKTGYLALKRGYRYLVIDPQVYVSFTRDEKRFSTDLIGYLDILDKYIIPDKTYPHFNQEILKRFVFEHNQNLRRSLRFLELSREKPLGTLKVYDLRKALPAVLQVQKILSASNGAEL